MTAGNYRDHRTYLVPLLRELHAAGGSAVPANIYGQVADRAGVTAAERAIGSERDRTAPVYKNRIQFARQSLVDARAIIGSSDPGWERGMWTLSKAGVALAKSKQDDAELDKELREVAAVGSRERMEARKKSKVLAGIEDNEADETEIGDEEDEDEDDTVDIAELVEEANSATMTTMLDHIRTVDDTAFEHLVGSVLKAALRAVEVRITPRSRDGGIDGLLMFDALGMRVAVFEVKRYAEDNVVGRPKIDAFATAARRRRAAHALFVTSSRFSDEAIDAARDEGIRLIDGIAFVELMARHGIGLRPRETFVVYEVDPAWSVEGPDAGTASE